MFDLINPEELFKQFNRELQCEIILNYFEKLKIRLKPNEFATESNSGDPQEWIADIVTK